MEKIINRISRISSLDELSADELAELIALLISHEVQPGGPYEFGSNYDNAQLNSLVYRLFAAKGKTLNYSKDIKLDEIEFSDLGVTTLKSPVVNETTTRLYDEVILDVRKIAGSDISVLEKIIRSVAQTDTNGEISEISSIFYLSLRDELQNQYKLSPATSRCFAYANIYTWVTYSLIDKLLDSNISSSLIPIVTILSRRIIYYHQAAGVSLKLIEDFFSIVDTANHEELMLRNKIRVDLSSDTIWIYDTKLSKTMPLMTRKSLAHTLGPVAIAKLLQKYINNSNVYESMSLYCSSRQLNDDLHDWEEDFRNGQVTYVINELFKKNKILPGKYKFSLLLKSMKVAYWDTVLEECCVKIKKDINKSIALLEGSILQVDCEFSKRYLKPLLQSADQARESHIYTKKFARAINRTSALSPK